ncbi:MAG: hypothetical protein MEQ07_02760 [Aquimonas sp.]|nr:hypothetical protein [Aquimonas sp.]
MSPVRTPVLLAVGVFAGFILAWAVGARSQAEDPASVAPSERRYQLSVHEIVQTLVLGDTVEGDYSRNLILSDGSAIKIDVRAVLVDGEQQVEIREGDIVSYLPERASLTRGNLLMSVRPLD